MARNKKPAPPPPPPRGSIVVLPSHLLMGGVLLAVGIAIGFGLRSQGQTERSPSATVTAQPAREPAPLAPPSPAPVTAAKSADEPPDQGRIAPPDREDRLSAKTPFLRDGLRAAPRRSPYLAAAVLQTFDDPEPRRAYEESVALVWRNRADEALPALRELRAQSEGMPRREPVLMLLLDALATAGEVEAARVALQAYSAEFPETRFPRQILIAQGKIWHSEGKRIDGPIGGRDGKAIRDELFGRARVLYGTVLRDGEQGPPLDEVQRRLVEVSAWENRHPL